VRGARSYQCVILSPAGSGAKDLDAGEILRFTQNDGYLCGHIKMLLGEYQHSVDDKGRLALPAKFRKTLAGGVVVTRGLDTCLYLYPGDEWSKLAEKLARLPLHQANSRAFARLMLAGASHAEIDSQGRILIPDYLRRYAGISSRAVIIGLYNRAEVWDEAKWQSYRANVESRTDEIAEKLGELGP